MTKPLLLRNQKLLSRQSLRHQLKTRGERRLKKPLHKRVKSAKRTDLMAMGKSPRVREMKMRILKLFGSATCLGTQLKIC
jgi:hypothetical protein